MHQIMLTLLQQVHVAKAKRTSTTMAVVVDASSSTASHHHYRFFSMRHKICWFMLVILPLFALILGYHQLGLIQMTTSSIDDGSVRSTIKPKNATQTSTPGPSSSSTTGEDQALSSSFFYASWDTLSQQAIPEAWKRQERHAEWKKRQQQHEKHQSTANDASSTITASTDYYNYNSKCHPIKTTTSFIKTTTVLITSNTNWTILYNDQSLIPIYSNLSDFLLGNIDHNNNNNNNTEANEEALCEIYDEPGRSDTAHFPHAMEHLYRCYSYWLSFPHLHAVLLYPKNHVIGIYATTSDMPKDKKVTTTTSNFLQGFVQAMIIHLNITLREQTSTSLPTTQQPPPPHPNAVRIKHTPNFLDGYAILSPLHAQTMVNKILGPPTPSSPSDDDDDDDGITNDNDKTTTTSTSSCPCSSSTLQSDKDNDDSLFFLQHLPRIAILNRKIQHKRSLLNVQELANALEDAILVANYYTNTNNNTHHQQEQQQQQQHNWTVPIVYFENATFIQQLQFFANYDIVITGHGAQLTGLPFMRQPQEASSLSVVPSASSSTTTLTTTTTTCRASIVEIFPFGYCIPSFFGSLAIASGHDHYYISIENNEKSKEQQIGNTNPFCFLNIKRRVQKRQVNLCPNWHILVQGILQIIKEWNDNNCSSRRHDRGSHHYSRQEQQHVCSCPP